MAKLITLVALIVSTFCFSSVVGEDKFFVEGIVYCDPCRLQIQSKLTHPIPGVHVTLECRKPNHGTVVFSSEGTSDQKGKYSIPVHGNHKDEVCEVKVINKDPQCNKRISPEASNKVVLTNTGVTVNPMSFMTESVDARCANLVEEMKDEFVHPREL